MAKLKTRNGKESEDGGLKLTRREVIKASAAAGALSVLAPRMGKAQEGRTPPTEPILGAAADSEETTPFIDDLPIPRPAVPKRLNPRPAERAKDVPGEAARGDHQRWNEFLPEVEYELNARAALHRFHGDYEPSYVWAFNDQSPGPTILNRYGVPIIVRFRNDLPEQEVHTGFGVSEITVHLHNGHTASESDGFAGDFFPVGQFKDNHYPNIYAGYDAFPPDGDPAEAMHTFWYHDHRMQFTAHNNYLGLPGMYFVYDETDPGHELNTPGSLRLPGYYGITDIPLVLSDKSFFPTANGRTELFQQVGAAPVPGNKWCVNGKIQPKFTVRRRKYRFRILNTGPAKEWNLSLIKPDGTTGTITVVATDANFLEHPVPVSPTSTYHDSFRNIDLPNGEGANGELVIDVAKRFDCIIDFAEFAAGAQVYLMEAAAQNVGEVTVSGLPPDLLIGNVLMRFDVIERESWFPPDTPPIPDTLTTYPVLPPTDAEFVWDFNRTDIGLDGSVQFTVNGMIFDPERMDHVILKGTTEEWLINNNTLILTDPDQLSNWRHPVHIHFEEFRVLRRFIRDDSVPVATGELPPNIEITVPPLQSGRQDVIRLPLGQSALIKMQFRDFQGRYLIHCHNMIHEDDFMMARWEIVSDEAALSQRREEIVEQRRLAGVSIEAGLPIIKNSDQRSSS